MTEADEWFLPGGAHITDDRKIRLRPPTSWERVELTLLRTPMSMNRNEIRTNWRGFQTAKKDWQAELETLLMVAGVKRGGYQRAMAGAFLRFPRRDKRDTNNFTTLLNKALGDALARDGRGNGYGAIPDDDERRFYFGGVEFEPVPGPARTLLWIYLQPKEDQ